MSLERPGRTRAAPALLWVGGLAMALLIAAIAYLVVGDDDLLARLGGQRTPESIEREMAQVPELRPMIGALRESYPDAHRQLLESVSAAANEGGQAAAEQAAFRFMRGFMLSKIDAVASAPPEELRRFARASIGVTEGLRSEDIGLCAQFIMRGFPQGARLSPNLVRLSGAATEAQIRAAAAGESPRRVERGPLSQEDAAAWIDRLETIDPRSAALITTDRLQRANPNEQCDAGLAIYRAVTDLPPDQGANVMAELVRAAAQTLR